MTTQSQYRPKSANRTLFLGIWSAPNYVYSNRRKLIRETWLKHVKDPHYHRGLLDVIGYGFILGQTSNQTAQKEIEEESKIYGDILQVKMDDTYRNLTLKTVSILNWVNSNYAHADFAIKIDDDVYVNVRNFATVLAELSPTEMSLYGHAGGGHDNVDRKGKMTPFSCKYIFLNVGPIIQDASIHFYILKR